MNVLDYSIRLGKLLRKTEEGRELFQLEMGIEEKYKDNEAFGQYEQFAEKKTSQFYFYSWNMAYKTFVNVLTDDSIEHRDFFLPTAELISSDDEIKSFALTAVKFGSIFEQLVAVIISGGEYEKVIPESWTYKVKNAISDVQISVERTLLVKTIAVFYKKHQNLLNSSATQKYLLMREKEKLLPFSEKALEIISETEDVSEEEKLLYEKMYLIMEAVKKGIFYGFWGMTNEIQKEELLNADTLLCLLLAAALVSGCAQKHKEGEPDVISSMKINQDETLTVVANRKQIEDKEDFAKLLVKKCKDNSFQSVRFSTDYGYATSLNLRVYLWEDEIEGQEPVMVVEYKPVEWGMDYDIVHDPEKFQMYVDGELMKNP